MHRLLHNRFAIQTLLHKSKSMLSFRGLDRWEEDRPVFVKFIKAGAYRPDPGLQDRMVRLHGLRHPLLASIDQAVLTPRTDLYMTRTFVEGTVLGTHDPALNDMLARSLVAACSLLESVGVCHGRLKPTNILVKPDGRAVLLDAALPQIVMENPAAHMSFLAPDVLAGDEATFASDLYSLGALLYRLYSGTDLFEDANPSLLRHKCLFATPVPLRERSDAPDSLAEAVDGLLTKEPSQRSTAFRTLARMLQPQLLPATRAPLTGRKVELIRIREGFVTGSGGLRVVTVEGETGAGKTRLLGHLSLLASLESRHLIIGRSFERDNRPFEPILQILERRLRRSDRRLQQWFKIHAERHSQSLRLLLPRLATLFHDDTLSEEPVSHGMLIADLVGTIVSLFASDPTLILAIDDIHWGDEGTLEVLEQLSWRSGETDGRILLSVRSGPFYNSLRELFGQWQNSDRIHFSRVPLSPLTSAEVLEMTANLGTGDAATARIVQYACGNPLFIEEYALRAVRGDCATERIRGVLEEQVCLLSRPLRSAAEAMSLFDKPISFEVASRCLRSIKGGLELQLDDLISIGMVVRSAADISFKHDGVRQTVYRMIPKARRRRLHGVLFWFFDGCADDAVRAFHADHAALYERAGDLYWKAAADCAKAGDYRTGIELFYRSSRAYKRAGLTPLREMTWTYAITLLSAGLARQAELLLLDLLASSEGGSNENARVYQALASCHFDNPVECLRYTSLAVRHISEDSPERSLLMVHMAQAYAVAGRASDAKRALGIARTGRGQSSEQETARRGITLLALCDHSAALKLFDGVSVADSVATRLATNRAVCLEHLGRLKEAGSCQENTLFIARRLGLLSVECQSLANLGAFEAKRGRFARAESLCDEAHRFLRMVRVDEMGNRVNLPLLSADYAFLLMETGRYAAARTQIASAVRQLKDDRLSQRAIWVAIKAAELYGRICEPESARKALTRVEESELFHGDFFTVERALICQPVSSIVDENRVEHLERCLALTERLETLHQRCRVLIELAASFVKLDDRAQARERLSEARTLASTHGYGPLAARIDLLESLASDTPAERSRFLARAYRRATRIGLSELAAECAFRIGQADFALERRSFREYLRECVSAVDAMAEGLPKHVRLRYAGSGWRSEARTLLEQTEVRVRDAGGLRGRASSLKSDDQLFRLTYQTAVRIGRATSIDELLNVVDHGVAAGMNAGVVIFLDARGEKEFHATNLTVDDALARSIGRLYKTLRESSFLGIPDSEGTAKGSKSAVVGWIPLTFRRHRFGGIYVRMRRNLTERQIEFLTTIAVNASSALAALLWSSEPAPEVRSVSRYKNIVGRSVAMEGIFSQIDIAARSEATVLIEGESGTGKELVARAIHDNGARAAGPFVPVDCGAIPETLIESELFGSCRGSFTGATADRVGLIEASNKGTLFLDEISNTSPALQVKLLRVLQEREVRRLGDTKGRRVDLRLIAATNSNLDTLVEESRFRQDLLYRLKVLHIVIPPLRQRREDIPDIAQAFLDRMNSTHGTRKRFHKTALTALMDGGYRGNVRELQNVIERAYFSTVGQEVISDVGVAQRDRSTRSLGVDAWFRRLTEGKEDFWNAVHAPYKSRDISREKVLALMDIGLRATRGSYKNLATLLNVQDREYRRFMDFLRRNDCQPDFRLYRSGFRSLRQEGAAQHSDQPAAPGGNAIR